MSTEKLYIDKELSWLSFNERVLQEAADKTVPLIERIRFRYFSNNLDEFYKVRFADVKRRILINREQGVKIAPSIYWVKCRAKRLNWTKILIVYTVNWLSKWPGGGFLVNESQLDPLQQKWISKYFHKEVLPHITPLLLRDDIDVLQFLKDEYAYIAVELKRPAIKLCPARIPTDPYLALSCYLSKRQRTQDHYFAR